MNVRTVARAVKRTLEERRRRDASGREVPPGPPSAPVLGHYPQMAGDRLSFLMRS